MPASLLWGGNFLPGPKKVWTKPGKPDGFDWRPFPTPTNYTGYLDKRSSPAAP